MNPNITLLMNAFNEIADMAEKGHRLSVDHMQIAEDVLKKVLLVSKE